MAVFMTDHDLMTVENFPLHVKSKVKTISTVTFNLLHNFEKDIIHTVGFAIRRNGKDYVVRFEAADDDISIWPIKKYLHEVIGVNYEDFTGENVAKIIRERPELGLDFHEFGKTNEFDIVTLFLVSNREKLQPYIRPYLPNSAGILRSMFVSIINRAVNPIFFSSVDTWAHLIRDREIHEHSCDFFLWEIISNIYGKKILELFRTFDELSTMGYEKNSTSGKIAIGRFSTSSGDIKFASPIKISEKKSVRKLLETCRGNGHLLFDGEEIYAISEKLRLTTGIGMIIKFEGKKKWEIIMIDPESNLSSYLRVSDGLVSVIRPRFNRSIFDSTFTEVFGDKLRHKIPGLVRSVELALSAKHGCILLISNEAPEEANRLSNQAFAVSPIYLEAGVQSGFFEVDGAVLIDLDGMCVAFGIILDGLANPNIGSRGRGSRFNSAVRYIETHKGKAMALVVSDDEDINYIT